MPNVKKQGAVTVEEHEDGSVIVYVDTFAISMMAHRREGEQSLVDHMAELAPASATNEIEAQKHGFKVAEELWPRSEGWQQYNVRVKPTQYKFELKARPRE